MGKIFDLANEIGQTVPLFEDRDDEYVTFFDVGGGRAALTTNEGKIELWDLKRSSRLATAVANELPITGVKISQGKGNFVATEHSFKNLVILWKHVRKDRRAKLELNQKINVPSFKDLVNLTEEYLVISFGRRIAVYKVDSATKKYRETQKFCPGNDIYCSVVLRCEPSIMVTGDGLTPRLKVIANVKLLCVFIKPY